MRVRPVFEWYDLWIGFFWDRRRRRLYILPLPTVGIVIEFGIIVERCMGCGEDRNYMGPCVLTEVSHVLVETREYPP